VLPPAESEVDWIAMTPFANEEPEPLPMLSVVVVPPLLPVPPLLVPFVR
jgi:hypothetical protein